MKESVWYHAFHNEIWVKRTRNTIERGLQAMIKVPDTDISVPDHLCFFTWKLDMKKAKQHIKKGWLVRLGVL